MAILAERVTPKQKIAFQDSLFFAKLNNESPKSKPTYDYNNVKRWTKRYDVFSLDKIFFPINTANSHWTLLVLHMQQRVAYYYDSLPGRSDRPSECFERMKLWLTDEAKDKKQDLNYDPSDWKLVEPQCPKQTNGYDCGVFTIMYMDFLVDDLPLDFTQDDIPAFREKIAADILRGSLRY